VAQAFGAWAISIAANDVVLDCNGHRIRQTDPGGAFPGIDAQARQNVTVRNCVVDGFHDGISFSNNQTGNYAVNILDNHVLNFRQQGIIAWGSSFRIEGNRITQGLGNDNGGITGIFLLSMDQNGAGTVIRGNLITDLHPPATDPSNDVTGIFVANVRDTVIADNVISNLGANAQHCAWGVYGSGATAVSATGNQILSPPRTGPDDGTQCGGIALFGTAEQQATNACRDNVVGHFNGNISGCLEISNTEL
jgi:hypothetical protein